MRWKILQLAENSSSLDQLLSELKRHPEYDLPHDGGLELLKKYRDILPIKIQKDILSN